jgi:hypothetical protein
MCRGDLIFHSGARPARSHFSSTFCNSHKSTAGWLLFFACVPRNFAGAHIGLETALSFVMQTYSDSDWSKLCLNMYSVKDDIFFARSNFFWVGPSDFSELLVCISIFWCYLQFECWHLVILNWLVSAMDDSKMLQHLQSLYELLTVNFLGCYNIYRYGGGAIEVWWNHYVSIPNFMQEYCSVASPTKLGDINWLMFIWLVL